MLDEIDNATDNEYVEEADNVQIGVVVLDKVGFKDVESALHRIRFSMSRTLFAKGLS
jgi:hypothetical protein